MKKIWMFILWVLFTICCIHPWFAIFVIIMMALVFVLNTKEELGKEYVKMLVLFWTAIIMFWVYIFMTMNWIVINLR